MPKKTKILCIFDGFGLSPKNPNNCIALAKMPNFRRLLKEYYWTTLNADGEMVGQEAGLVGNSEVGHMNIGGLKLVPQLSFQVTKSAEKGFSIPPAPLKGGEESYAPDQIFDPQEFLREKWYPPTPLERGSMELASQIDLRMDKTGYHLYSNPRLQDRSKQMREKMTQAEQLVWNNILRADQTGYKFNRQKTIGNYIVDFYSTELLLIIEIDGEIHNEDYNQEYDKQRDSYLAGANIQILRIKNKEVLDDFEQTKIKILELINNRAKIVEIIKQKVKSQSLSITDDNQSLSVVGSSLPLSKGVGGYNKTIHLIGLFSTGQIHSDLRHWVGAIEAAVLAGAEKIVLHLISDGRDSDRQSLVETWETFEKMLEEKMGGVNPSLQGGVGWQSKIFLGSLGGRFYAMDRDKNWERVSHGIASFFDRNLVDLFKEKMLEKYQIATGFLAKRYELEVENHYSKITDLITEIATNSYKQEKFDENILPQAIKNSIEKNDSVWLINFRTDRMKQFATMLCDINEEFGLNLTILGMNDYGIGKEIFEQKEEAEKPNEDTMDYFINHLKDRLVDCITNNKTQEIGCLALDLQHKLGFKEQIPIIFDTEGRQYGWQHNLKHHSEISILEYAKILIYTVFNNEAYTFVSKNNPIVHFVIYPLNQKKDQLGLCKYVESDGCLKLVSVWHCPIEYLEKSLHQEDFDDYMEFSKKILAQLGTVNSPIPAISGLPDTFSGVNRATKEHNKTGFQNSQILFGYYPIFKNQPVQNTLAETISRGTANSPIPTLSGLPSGLSGVREENLYPKNTIDNEKSQVGFTQLHIAETEKYNHVTYFFNGGQNKKWEGEDWVVIDSNKVASHGEKPEMKAKEVTDYILQSLQPSQIESEKFEALKRAFGERNVEKLFVKRICE